MVLTRKTVVFLFFPGVFFYENVLFKQKSYGPHLDFPSYSKVPCACPQLPFLWDGQWTRWAERSCAADVVGLGGDPNGEMTAEELTEVRGRGESDRGFGREGLSVFFGGSGWFLF